MNDTLPKDTNETPYQIEVQIPQQHQDPDERNYHKRQKNLKKCGDQAKTFVLLTPPSRFPLIKCYK